MVFRDSERQDEQIHEGLTAFVDSLSNARTLYRAIVVFSLANLVLWSIALLVPDVFVSLIDFLGNFGDKPKYFPFVIPFFSGGGLAYALIRHYKPDIESGKLLESELMGSVSYDDASRKRFWTWSTAGVAGVLNVVCFGLMIQTLSSTGLHLFGE